MCSLGEEIDPVSEALHGEDFSSVSEQQHALFEEIYWINSGKGTHKKQVAAPVDVVKNYNNYYMKPMIMSGNQWEITQYKVINAGSAFIFLMINFLDFFSFFNLIMSKWSE